MQLVCRETLQGSEKRRNRYNRRFGEPHFLHTGLQHLITIWSSSLTHSPLFNFTFNYLRRYNSTNTPDSPEPKPSYFLCDNGTFCEISSPSAGAWSFILSVIYSMESKTNELRPVSDNISFPKAEEEVLAYWKEIDAFNTSLKLSEGRPEYTFYDGPPFATGLPHYGHILAGTIKDIVTRYAHQTGHHVVRRFGWDTHGVPVEFEIDKKLGITCAKDVEKIGIAK